MNVVFIILIAIVAYILIFFTFPSILGYFMLFGKRTTTEADERHLEKTYMAPYYDNILNGLDFFRKLGGEDVWIASYDGLKLKGKYYDHQSAKTAILVHGYNDTPLYNFSVEGKDFYERGYNVLMIIQRAHTGSEGKHSTMGLKEQKDVLKWTRWCLDEKHCKQLILSGVSMGGATVAYASDKLKDSRVKALVIDCAFISPYDQFKKLCIQYHVPWFFIMPTLYIGMKLMQKTDIRERTCSCLEKNTVPTLFMHGTNDRTVSMEQADMNYSACASEKIKIVVDGADHAECYHAMNDEQRKLFWGFIERKIENENICHSDRFFK